MDEKASGVVLVCADAGATLPRWHDPHARNARHALDGHGYLLWLLLHRLAGLLSQLVAAHNYGWAGCARGGMVCLAAHEPGGAGVAGCTAGVSRGDGDPAGSGCRVEIRYQRLEGE